MHFLVLSHHRSGSNFLTDTLQQHDCLTVIDEPLSMHTGIFPELDLVRWTAEEYDEEVLHHALTRAPVAQRFVRDLFDYLRSAPPGRGRGFKETILFEKLPWLHRALPAIRVIHLVRDPRAVVHSLLRLPMRKQWRYERSVPFYARTYGDVTLDLRSDNELDRCISSWLIRHREAVTWLSRFGYVTVRLEDIVRSPDGELHRLMGFLGFEVRPRQLDFIARSQSESRGGPYSTFRHRDEILHAWETGLPSDVQRHIAERVHADMEQLGYV